MIHSVGVATGVVAGLINRQPVINGVIGCIKGGAVGGGPACDVKSGSTGLCTGSLSSGIKSLIFAHKPWQQFDQQIHLLKPPSKACVVTPPSVV